MLNEKEPTLFSYLGIQKKKKLGSFFTKEINTIFFSSILFHRSILPILL